MDSTQCRGDLEVGGLRFRFRGQTTDLLHLTGLRVGHGQTVGISGASGAGKSTLLHCLTGIEAIAAGSIRWGDTDIGTLGGEALARWRVHHMGIVFQDFHLVEGLGALDNILLPASFCGWRATPALRARAAALLERVGAPDRRAELLSRGERQRVAVARALLFSPAIVVADEPTASLDPDNREVVSQLLLDLCGEHGATLLVVSHEGALLDRLDRRFELRDGALHASGSDRLREPPHV